MRLNKSVFVVVYIFIAYNFFTDNISAAPATYKKSKICSTCTKADIWKAVMEVMKEYDLDKINKEEGYITTYAIKKADFPFDYYVSMVKVYDDHFEIKCDIQTGNIMFRGSYEKKEKEIISQIEELLKL